MSLAPARIVSLRSATEPAVSFALSMNFSKVLRACSKLASALERISLGISKRTFSLILLLLVPPRSPAPPDIKPATLHRDDATRSPNCRETQHTNARTALRFGERRNNP